MVNTKNQIIYQVLLEEFKTCKFTSEIINKDSLSFSKMQRYVIGTCLSKNYSYNQSDITKFVNLNYEVGNIDTDINSIVSRM